MGLMRPGCEEIARRLASDDGSGKPGLAVRLHLLMCRHCRRYRDQLLQIREAARAMLSGSQDASEEELRTRILRS